MSEQYKTLQETKVHMTEKYKTSQETKVHMTEVVLPEHTNLLNQLMGGRLMYWMDVASFIVAQRHANRSVVTASVDNVSFKNPIQLGNMVNLQAQMTRAFRTSMEVYVRVYSENMMTGERFESNSAFFTLVALGQNGRPAEVPLLRPESEEEKEFFEGAARRRRVRLLLARSKISGFDEIMDRLEAEHLDPE